MLLHLAQLYLDAATKLLRVISNDRSKTSNGSPCNSNPNNNTEEHANRYCDTTSSGIYNDAYLSRSQWE